MSIYYLSYPIEALSAKKHVLALGFFDGVHIGHQALLRKTLEMADRVKGTAAVLTFHPHPRVVLGKEKDYKNYKYVTPLTEKVLLFKQYGMKDIYVMEFNPVFSRLSKEEFIKEVIYVLQARGVVVGFNFTFGRGGLGNANTLQKWSEESLEVDVVEPVLYDGSVVSSTRVRKALMEGQMEEVTGCLNRGYAIKGKVVRGDQKGREIGFPTANLSLSEPYILPSQGVYVVRVWIDGSIKEIEGIMNIGFRPTVNVNKAIERVEIHLFDWDQNIYGSHLRVELLHYLRKEIKFPSIRELSMQIKTDVDRAKKWFLAFAVT